MLVLLAVGPLTAGPITYVESGQLTGTLGTTPLTNAAFTFTFYADTTNITGAGTGANPFLNPALSTAIVIGASNGSFSEAVDTGVNNVDGIIGFVDAALTAGITFNSSGAVGYNLATPISVSATASFAANGSFATSLGTLAISAIRGAQDLTFTATTGVPEPATFSLLVVGLLGVALRAAREGQN